MSPNFGLSSSNREEPHVVNIDSGLVCAMLTLPDGSNDHLQQSVQHWMAPVASEDDPFEEEDDTAFVQ